MTQQQALYKLTALCARAEYCQQDMLDKMRKWELSEQDQASIMEYLLKEKYIDEVRFTRHFVNDKLKYNKWGKRKIEQALYRKRIPESIYRSILDDVASSSIDGEDGGNAYEDVLRPLLEAKLRTVKGKNAYEIKGKLIRFALSRGFEMSDIMRIIPSLDTGVGEGEDADSDTW